MIIATSPSTLLIFRVLFVAGIVLAIVLPQRFRNSSSALLRAISRPRGVLPSGAGGAWTRRDRWRAAGAQAIGAVVFIGFGAGVFTVADHWPPATPQNNIGAFVGVMTSFYGLILMLLCIGTVFGAILRADPKAQPAPVLPSTITTIGTSPQPIDSKKKSPVPEAAPMGIRIASILCWVVGIFSLVVGLATGVPAAVRDGGRLVLLTINLLTGIGVCVAGYLIWRQRRLGALIIVLAWVLPAVMSFLAGTTVRAGPPLLLLAMLFSLANWKKLH